MTMKAIENLAGISLAVPRLAIAIALATIAAGVAIFLNRGVDVLPEIKVPRVTIQSETSGLTAEETEQLVSIPIENAMNGLDGVRSVRSSSSGGLSFVWVDFDWNVDEKSARFKVFERLGQIRESLPEGIETEIAPAISVSGEIMMIALVSRNNGIDGLKLREIAEYSLHNRLLSIPKIAQVTVSGGNLPEVQVRYSPSRLAQYDLGVEDLIEAVTQSRSWLSGGYLPDVKGEELPIRQIARADAIDELRLIRVGGDAKRPLRAGDVATIERGAAPRRGSASYNGMASVVLSVMKAPGGNTLELTKLIEKELDDFQLPEGVAIIKDAYRQSDFINESIANVQSTTLYAIIIVIIVLSLTMMNWRSLLIVLFAMPVSIFAGIALFPRLGIDINIMTLGGLAVAAGDIVDSSIILVEILQRKATGHDKGRIIDAVKEVAPGILFSGLVISLVFIPLFFLKGVEGQLFWPLALAYLAVFGCSLAISFLLVPALSYLLGTSKHCAAGKKTPIAALLQKVYSPFLKLSIAFPKSLILLFILLLGAAVWRALNFGSDFMPALHEDSLTVFVSTVPGTSLAESERIGDNVASEILKMKGVKSVLRKTGRAERDQHAEPVSTSELIVRMDSNQDATRLKEEIRALTKAIPGVSSTIGYPIAHRISAVLSGGAAELSLDVSGEDIDNVRAATKEIGQLLKTSKAVGDFQANREILVNSLRIDYDQERLAAENLSPESAGRQVSAAFNGFVAGTIVKNRSYFDIALRINEDEANGDDIGDLLLKTGDGRFVKLGEVARISREMTSNMIMHRNGNLISFLTLNPAAGVSTGELVETLEEKIKPILAKYNCTASFGGSYAANKEARLILSVSLVAILAIIAAILAIATRSAKFSAIVLLQVPLSLIGAIALVEFTGKTVTIASIAGFITVIGFVIRNGLLLVNRYSQLLSEGANLVEAIVTGSKERMLPIIMTSLTTIIGLVPLVISANMPGGEILSQLATVQLGGLSFAMLSSLLVVPAMASLGKRKSLK